MEHFSFQLSWSGVKSTNPTLEFWDCLGRTQRIRESFRLEKTLKILESRNSGIPEILVKIPGSQRSPRLSPTLSKCHIQLLLGLLWMETSPLPGYPGIGHCVQEWNEEAGLGWKDGWMDG